MPVLDVVNKLKSGELSPADVPIEYIIRDGNPLIVNTRSAAALEMAGFSRSEWVTVNKTGDIGAELRLTDQLERNGLSNRGIESVRPSFITPQEVGEMGEE